MNDNTFPKLIDPTKYQVFIFSCKMSVPFSFTLHTWIVTVDHGKVDRYDIWGHQYPCNTKWGYLYKNLLEPWLGVRVLPLYKLTPNAERFSGHILHKIEGEVGSKAEKIVMFMRDRAFNYPYVNKYHYFPGPNSNTFVQWVLDQFPDLNFKLPWYAFGKHYK